MKWWWKTLICILFLNPLFFLSAATIDYSLYFPAVVQGQSGHDNSGNCKNALNPQLTVNANSRINGTLSNSLKFCTIQDNNSGKSCDTNAGGSRSCTITGNNSLGLNLGQSGYLTPSSNSQSITINSNDCPTGSYILDGSVTQFSSLTINVTCNVILNAASSDYIFGSITLNSNSTLTLPVGNFWIQSLTVNQGNVVLSANSGRRQVYVQNALNINTTKGLNYNGSSADLLLIAYNNVIFNTASENHLYLYSDTVTTLNSSAVIYGRVTTNQLVLNKGTINDAVVAKSTIDHYEIRYPDSQITCEPAAITINACTNSDTSSCTKDTTASSSVTLSAPTSGWSNNPVTLTNGTGSVSLNHYAVGNVTLGLNATSYTCFKNGVVDSSCQLPFVASAFSFDFPTFYAGSNSGNVTLKALQASSSNPAVCTTLFANKTQNVTFASQYILPGSGKLLPTLNGSSLNSNTAAVTLPLAFDSTGAASLNLAYNDAGVLGITAQTTIDSAAGTLSISGSDSVAVLPAKILLTAEGQTACNESSDTDYAGCAVYKTVGQPFTLSAKAGYLSGSFWNTTANFSTSHLAASALPSVQHQLVAPSTGTLPALASTSLSFTAGTASASLNESDVGVYQYGVTDFVPYSAYQNESPQKTVALSWSDPVGRFIPAKLQAAVITQGTLTTDTCLNNSINAALGYTGQALSFATMPTLSVAALGSDGSTVMKNYQGAFAKITSVTPSGSGAFIANLLPKNNVNSLTSLATWAAGSWSTLTNAYNLLYSFGADDRFTFTKTNTNQVAPFETSLTISALADSDGVSASSLPLNLLPMAPDTSAFKVYSGRLTLESVNGAENNSLALPFYMQYWNGSAYAINKVDNCTSLTGSALQMNNLTSWTGIPLRVASATNGVATTTASLSPAKVSSGAGAISFTAPNASGWVDIAASSSLPDWMKDFTLPSGLTPARASFGYYHGNNRLIYRREVFGSQ